MGIGTKQFVKGQVVWVLEKVTVHKGVIYSYVNESIHGVIWRVWMEDYPRQVYSTNIYATKEELCEAINRSIQHRVDSIANSKIEICNLNTALKIFSE